MSPERAAAFDREYALQRLASEELDVLVVGGGITGAGVLLDAASRGLRCGLVEREDFAAGTSSKSSKLVHGGLRYLQQRELGLVHESLVERQRLLGNAPHLVEPLPFVIPLFGQGGVTDRAVARGYSSALWMYDLAGGWRIGRRHRRLSAGEVVSELPTLRPERVVAGFLYYDAHADDARLTLSLVRTAVLEHGALAANHAAVRSLLRRSGGQVAGAVVDPGDGRSIEVRAGAVVNATGVWADEVVALEEGSGPPALRPAKGVHLTLRRSSLPCEKAAVLPVPGDRRSVFVIPWGREHTYVGTTDTDYRGALCSPRADEQDVAYLLAAVNAAVTEPVGPGDVTSAWAGLRPLLATDGRRRRAPSERTADLSRRHRVSVSRGGLVTVTGGKLTTYRRMAEDTVDALAGPLGRRLPPSRTTHLSLRGASGGQGSEPPPGAKGVPDASLAAHLRSRYGGEAPVVAGIAGERPELSRPLVDGLAYIGAEAVHAARHEMARTVADVLARRTRALLLDAGGALGAARSVAGLMGAELGWDEARAEAEARGFEEQVAREGFLLGAHPPGRRP